MDFSKFPWEQGIGVVFGVVLLKILIDMVYKKIPRGFRLLDARLCQIENAVKQVHEDHQEAMSELKISLTELNKKKRLPRSRPGRRGGGGAKGRA